MDNPIHLDGKEIKVTISLSQRELDGLHMLGMYCAGLQDAKLTGQIPGLFDLVMHYRSLAGEVRVAKKVNNE